MCVQYLFKLGTDHCECFMYVFRASCDCDNSLGTRAIGYVDLSTTLKIRKKINFNADNKHYYPMVVGCLRNAPTIA